MKIMHQSNIHLRFCELHRQLARIPITDPFLVDVRSILNVGNVQRIDNLCLSQAALTNTSAEL